MLGRNSHVPQPQPCRVASVFAAIVIATEGLVAAPARTRAVWQTLPATVSH